MGGWFILFSFFHNWRSMVKVELRAVFGGTWYVPGTDTGGRMAEQPLPAAPEQLVVSAVPGERSWLYSCPARS